MDPEPLPVACTLDAAASATRRERWLALSARALIEKSDAGDGVRLRFRATDGVERELRELASLERDCCGFATWTVVAASGELTLDVRAEGDGVAAVHALFA